ncbi:MAG TPA: hypothetical protein VFH95_15255 [Candidatus Kapabacteria bacterium]|nr:hypothetical protein [Candidatus Kapabacteria bacterium]
MAETTTTQAIPTTQLSYGAGNKVTGTYKTATLKTTFFLARVKENDLVQLVQQQAVDGWNLVSNFPTIRGLRPRHFHTLLFRKD